MVSDSRVSFWKPHRNIHGFSHLFSHLCLLVLRFSLSRPKEKNSVCVRSASQEKRSIFFLFCLCGVLENSFCCLRFYPSLVQSREISKRLCGGLNLSPFATFAVWTTQVFIDFNKQVCFFFDWSSMTSQLNITSLWKYICWSLWTHLQCTIGCFRSFKIIPPPPPSGGPRGDQTPTCTQWSVWLISYHDTQDLLSWARTILRPLSASLVVLQMVLLFHFSLMST